MRQQVIHTRRNTRCMRPAALAEGRIDRAVKTYAGYRGPYSMVLTRRSPKVRGPTSGGERRATVLRLERVYVP